MLFAKKKKRKKRSFGIDYILIKKQKKQAGFSHESLLAKNNL